MGFYLTTSEPAHPTPQSRIPRSAYPRSSKVISGHRFLNTELGQWLSRDPMEEEGGVNLYAFCINDGAGRVDALGLQSYCHCINTSIDLWYRCSWSSFWHIEYEATQASDGGTYFHSVPHKGLLGLPHSDYLSWISVTVLPHKFDNGVVRYDPKHCECGAGTVETLPYTPHVKITGPWVTSGWVWGLYLNSGVNYWITQVVLPYRPPQTIQYTVEVSVEGEICSSTSFSVIF